MVKGIGRMTGSNRARKRRNNSSPTRTQSFSSAGFDPTSSSSRPSTLSPAGVSVLDRHLVTEDDSLDFFEKLRISPPGSDSNNPRSFPYSVKQQCWEKADKVRGRDPDRWRLDPLGNTVFRKLVGCPGCLCHDYDHIVPYSKRYFIPLSGVKQALEYYITIRVVLRNVGIGWGGKSTLENCQVLQATVNRSKGNRTEFSRADLIQKSSYCRVSGRDMDLLELSAYGNVRRGQESGGCRIQ